MILYFWHNVIFQCRDATRICAMPSEVCLLLLQWAVHAIVIKIGQWVENDIAYKAKRYLYPFCTWNSDGVGECFDNDMNSDLRIGQMGKILSPATAANGMARNGVG